MKCELHAATWDDVKKIIVDTGLTARNQLDVARRGKQSHEETKALADALVDVWAGLSLARAA